MGPPPMPIPLATALDRLEGEIDRAPKSIAWRARAVIGERMPWYDNPEEPDIREPSLPRSSAAY
jgi:hypothetical protein